MAWGVKTFKIPLWMSAKMYLSLIHSQLNLVSGRLNIFSYLRFSLPTSATSLFEKVLLRKCKHFVYLLIKPMLLLQLHLRVSSREKVLYNSWKLYSEIKEYFQKNGARRSPGWAVNHGMLLESVIVRNANKSPILAITTHGQKAQYSSVVL